MASQRRLSARVRRQIEEAYVDLGFPGAFGGVLRLAKNLREMKGLDVGAQDVKRVLEKLPVYQMHMLSRTRFRRRRLKAAGAGIQFQGDLAQMSEHNGFRYFLLLVDLYSNYVYVRAVKSKTGGSVRAAFSSIFKDNQLFKFTGLGTDGGREFTSNRTFLKKLGIELYIRRGPNKAQQAENFIRIFKSVLYRHLRFSRTKNWPGALQRVADQLNHRRQKNLGPYRPADINSPFADPQTRDFMKKKFAGSPAERGKKWPREKTFRLGQFVYVSYPKGKLDAGFDVQRGTIFRVGRVDRSERPYMYTLDELDGTEVERHFYAAELKSAPNPASIEHEIDNILDEKTTPGGKRLYLVSWTHYPKKYEGTSRGQKYLISDALFFAGTTGGLTRIDWCRLKRATTTTTTTTTAAARWRPPTDSPLSHSRRRAPRPRYL